ncbi:collagen-like triple helix repeat-containing protein [Nocardioides aromaticivorans]|uniref:collagen-like triple helix repeat-containing protein n=1 Tax=Nocardioides aromaticivorans TaxID=200618 RepID=UPI001A8D49E3|nr:collagen-like protein [Nocardioides aromaticivorans]
MSKHRPTARSTVRSIAVAAVTTLAAPALLAVTSSAADAANAAPRIVGAAMVDNDKDDRADELRLTYSEPVSHPLDTSTFPFKVTGYTITRIGATTLSRTLRITLAEKAGPDIAAKPSVTYTRTTSQAVRDDLKAQAVAQTFTGTRPLDRDGDGYAATDCAASDAAINPSATDVPELTFTDADCDGLDGDAATAIFVDPAAGDDVNPGTRTQPVKTLPAAFNLRSGTRTRVLATGLSAPSATVVNVPDGLSVYGGYDSTWKRTATYASTNGLAWRVDGASTLELLNIGLGGDQPALRVHGGTARLNRVKLVNSISETNSIALLVTGNGTVMATDSSITSGSAGSRVVGNKGVNGIPVEAGENGEAGSCDTFNGGAGGVGGGLLDSSPVAGGWGGLGGRAAGDSGDGNPGDPGSAGATGGTAGKAGDPGKAGGNGAVGAPGTNGAAGVTVKGTFASTGWTPARATNGKPGTRGQGGAGGGGGGGQVGLSVVDGVGNGGGGGGEGGYHGGGGDGGNGGYASIAAYVTIGKLVLKSSTVTSGAGGNGGTGGAGGTGMPGGAGGKGGTACLAEVGRGGDGGAGGKGGNGGRGGDGQGGPSIGVFTATYGVLESTGSTIVAGAAGTGPLAIRAAVY